MIRQVLLDLGFVLLSFSLPSGTMKELALKNYIVLVFGLVFLLDLITLGQQ